MFSSFFPDDCRHNRLRKSTTIPRPYDFATALYHTAILDNRRATMLGCKVRETMADLTYQKKSYVIAGFFPHKTMWYRIKFSVFWDVLPCSQVDVDRRFWGAYCLHHQGDEWALREKIAGYIGPSGLGWPGDDRWQSGSIADGWSTVEERESERGILWESVHLDSYITSYLFTKGSLEFVRNSETSVYFNETTRCCMPESCRQFPNTSLQLGILHIFHVSSVVTSLGA
jgi:hypothetical protein